MLINGNIKAQVQEGVLGSTIPSAASVASYYFISKPGELTMQVNIWGYVRNPGRYEIPSSTDLIQLVSYAGGPIPDGDMSDVKVTRLLKNDSTYTHQEFNVDLADLTNIKSTDLNLYPGDTIFIDRTSWSSFRDILTVMIPVATVAMTAWLVIITNQNSNLRQSTP
jgi:protein involved in polysaccharide export with SLBB domain